MSMPSESTAGDPPWEDRHERRRSPSKDRDFGEVIILVEKLEIGYGRTTILKDISFDVREREVVVILGPSGCGKTTLLRALIGLLPPKGGRICIAGEEIGEGSSPEALARVHEHFGVLFQEGALIGSLTLGENVALPLEEFSDLPQEVIDEIVRLKLDMVGLGGSVHRQPAELSGGMLKRAGLARGMAMDPKILFCDEPTAGLDPPTAIEIDRLLLEMRRILGITIVVISHALNSIHNIADRCLMLHPDVKGIIAEGTLQELEDSDDPKVRDFFRRQLEEENRPGFSAGRREDR